MIYTLPFIAAIIGWFTNFLAVKMLFRPKNPVKIGPFTIQGVFPKRQHVVAERLAQMVTSELLSIEEIAQKINDPKNIGLITDRIEARIENYLEVTLPANYPITSIFVRKKAKSKIKDEFMSEVSKMAPEVISQYIANIENSIDLEEIIREKVATLSPVKLEALITKMLQREFKFIEVMGGVIGFIVGLIQLCIVLITQ